MPLMVTNLLRSTVIESHHGDFFNYLWQSMTTKTNSLLLCGLNYFTVSIIMIQVSIISLFNLAG
jgi:hypothetical protein